MSWCSVDPTGTPTTGDYFDSEIMSADVAVKNSYGLLHTTRAFERKLINCRVDTNVSYDTGSTWGKTIYPGGIHRSSPRVIDQNFFVCLMCRVRLVFS